jgi:hypothetical protein
VPTTPNRLVICGKHTKPIIAPDIHTVNCSPERQRSSIVMGCTASSMLSRRGCSDDEHDVVIKIGTVVIHDSIHTMIERDRRRKAAQSTTTATESNEYCPRAPHPLLTSRHAAAVVVTATEDTRLSFSKTTCPQATPSIRTTKTRYIETLRSFFQISQCNVKSLATTRRAKQMISCS